VGEFQHSLSVKTGTSARRGGFHSAIRTKSGSMLGTILIILVILLLLGALPTWPYSGSWGYYPSGTLGLVLVIVVILALLGRL
jgi:hypothetical protein